METCCDEHCSGRFQLQLHFLQKKKEKKMLTVAASHTCEPLKDSQTNSKPYKLHVCSCIGAIVTLQSHVSCHLVLTGGFLHLFGL